MANWQVISLDTTTPQLRAPGTGDGYSFNSGSTQLGVWTTTGLGIGTASPVFKLVVSNAGAQGFEFDPSIGLMQIFNRSTSSYGEFRPYASLMRFFTGSSPTETMRLDSSGNLGVGTTSPAYKLDLDAGTGVNIAARFVARSTATIYCGTNDAGIFDATGVNGWSTNAASNFVRVYTNGSEKARIDSSGNLGLNTASPAKMLDLASNNTGITTGDPGNILRFTDTDTTSAADQPFGRIEWYSADTDAAGVKAYIQGQSQDGSPDGNLVFATHYLSGGGLAERMRIDYAGNVGIGTASPGALLDVYSATTSNYARVGSASTFSAGLSIAANANTHLTSGSLIYQDSSNRLNLLNYANAALRLGTNNTFRVSVPAAGGMVVGTAALATNATDGFLYVPTCAGAPTGTPTAQTGTAPIVIDTTNNKLYFYSGGAWRDAGP